MSTQEYFWLHVPLETLSGQSLKVRQNEYIDVLGRRARLLEQDLPRISEFVSADAAVVKQWLLFDPITKVEAETLLAELRAKLPVLSMRMGAPFRVSSGTLEVAQTRMYNGPLPTLIPQDFEPSPVWGSMAYACEWVGSTALGPGLDECPAVSDERLLAALDLYVAAEYDALPRSRFLAYLTILDSLAEPPKRSDTAIAWLDRKIKEAEVLKDSGLISSLKNLKLGSRGAAVRELVRRAANAEGYSQDESQSFVDLSKSLYSTRSSLSHAGTSKVLDVGTATRLVKLVLDAAIKNPVVLDINSALSNSAQC